jgi:hypothetical protein
MNRREFLNTLGAATIAIAVPDIVVGVVRPVYASIPRNTATVALKDVRIVEWDKKRGVVVIRATVPFRNEELSVLTTASERLLDDPRGPSFIIEDIMTMTKMVIKRDKNIDVDFLGYTLPRGAFKRSS